MKKSHLHAYKEGYIFSPPKPSAKIAVEWEKIFVHGHRTKRKFTRTNELTNQAAAVLHYGMYLVP